MLELYGFTKDDFMESMKDMQFVVENNKIFAGKSFETIIELQSNL